MADDVMITCRKCGETKPVSAYRTDARSGKVGNYACRPCLYAANTARMAQHRAEANAYTRAWYQRDIEKRRQAARIVKKRGAARDRVAVRRFRAAHPDIVRAHNVLRSAVRSGLLIKPSQCETCGITPPPRRLHAHHHDHARPLDVRWLCAACHRATHLTRSA